MKRWTGMLVVALVVSLGAGMAEAGKANKGAKPAGKGGKAAHDGVVGMVEKVDGSTIMLQTRGKNAGEVSVVTDANTKFEGVTDLSQVKAGMRVVATPTSGTAQKVVVRQGRAGANKQAGKGKGKKGAPAAAADKPAEKANQ
jgi:hypothetical protein